jgi:hypothetical protein
LYTSTSLTTLIVEFLLVDSQSGGSLDRLALPIRYVSIAMLVEYLYEVSGNLLVQRMA